MKDFISLRDFGKSDIFEIFDIADGINAGEYGDILKGKSAVLFFPASSIRTRVTFEKGVYLLGGQPILFPTETLDKKEATEDVCGYLDNWADLIVVRHRDIELVRKMAKASKVPVINAMTDVNHPCEVLSDMYALSKIRGDFTKDKFLFCGINGNIGKAWKEAADVMGFNLQQCCGKGYELEALKTYDNISNAIVGKDIICTDSLPKSVLGDFKNCRVTLDAMKLANKGAVLNPCPPFYRGEEVSADAVSSEYFVGYEFKKHLLAVQQAVMIYCLTR